jgi:hypothetical protein
MSFPKFPHPKDPDDVADYAIDWTARLDAGDSLADSLFEVVSGTILLGAQSIDGNKATVWVNGGEDGETATILNRVTTTGGRQYDQTFALKIKTQ